MVNHPSCLSSSQPTSTCFNHPLHILLCLNVSFTNITHTFFIVGCFEHCMMLFISFQCLVCVSTVHDTVCHTTCFRGGTRCFCTWQNISSSHTGEMIMLKTTFYLQKHPTPMSVGWGTLSLDPPQYLSSWIRHFVYRPPIVKFTSSTQPKILDLPLLCPFKKSFFHV
jgi:hypothetical protein